MAAATTAGFLILGAFLFPAPEADHARGTAGASNGTPAGSPPGPTVGPTPVRRVALTFDDLPGTGLNGASCSADSVLALNQRLLRQLEEVNAPAAGFVNEGLACGGDRILETVLRLWLDAGHALGNHTHSHIDIEEATLEAYVADLERGERVTRRLLAERGRELRYFRPPLLHTGSDSVTRNGLQRYLDANGYTMAPVTIDNQEWVFEAVYRRARAMGDTATVRRVADAYVPYLERVVAHFESRSVDVLGYEPAQVLLLHANRINADHFGRVARMLRDRGYTFVSLEEALADPAYGSADGYVGPRGLSWIHRWALARGLEVDGEPREPGWLAKLFEEGL